MLRHVRLILMAPKYSGNVGACARVAANFGVEDVVVVAPQCDVLDAQARLYATGPTVQTLESFRVLPTLAAALSDCAVAIAVARRVGDLSPEVLDFRELATTVLNPEARQSQIALVFGREDNCLTVEEMHLCAYQMALPTSAFMPTMNLSHAVAVVLSRLFTEATAPEPPPAIDNPYKRPATIAEFEGLVEHLSRLMHDADIDKAGNPERALVRLRKALQKARLSAKEVSLFRAVFSKIQVALGTRRRTGHNSGA